MQSEGGGNPSGQLGGLRAAEDRQITEIEAWGICGFAFHCEHRDHEVFSDRQPSDRSRGYATKRKCWEKGEGHLEPIPQTRDPSPPDLAS